MRNRKTLNVERWTLTVQRFTYNSKKLCMRLINGENPDKTVAVQRFTNFKKVYAKKQKAKTMNGQIEIFEILTRHSFWMNAEWWNKL